MTDEDADREDIRERAQAIRDELADEVDAPAEQDDHAAARKRADSDEQDDHADARKRADSAEQDDHAGARKRADSDEE